MVPFDYYVGTVATAFRRIMSSLLELAVLRLGNFLAIDRHPVVCHNVMPLYHFHVCWEIALINALRCGIKNAS